MTKSWCVLSLWLDYFTMFFFLIKPRTPSSTHFPYTTLFRSGGGGLLDRRRQGHVHGGGEAHVRHGRRLEGIRVGAAADDRRSEEHTSELQSPDHLVCRILLEKKKYYTYIIHLRDVYI